MLHRAKIKLCFIFRIYLNLLYLHIRVVFEYNILHISFRAIEKRMVHIGLNTFAAELRCDNSVVDTCTGDCCVFWNFLPINSAINISILYNFDKYTHEIVFIFVLSQHKNTHNYVLQS